MQENKDDSHNFISLSAPSTPTKYSSESIISKAKKYIGLDRSFTLTSSNSVDTLDSDAGDSTSMINKLTTKISKNGEQLPKNSLSENKSKVNIPNLLHIIFHHN